jgi:hypothetical protein
MKTTIANPVNTTNAMGKKRKRPKNIHKSKKDEENILSKDIEDDNIRYMMDTKKNLKPREDLKSSFTLKNLRFKPQKYKGSYLPYHLRWIFNNNVKSNEIVLLNEIEGLENEINRLKILKLVNRECRKLAGLPFGVTTNFCQCCHLFEKKKHDCSHKFCNENCPRKKIEESMNNLLKNYKIKDFKDNGNGNIPKDKNIKKIFDETNNNNNHNNLSYNNSNELFNQDINNKNVKNNNNIQSSPSIIKHPLINNNGNNITNSNSNNVLEHKIILDRNMNKNIIDNNSNNNINLSNGNDSNKVNNTQTKKKLIFGTVERSNKEKKSIFLVKSDSNMMLGNNSTYGIFGNDSNIKINNDVKSNNNDSQEDNNNKDNYDDINNYTVSIESDGEGDGDGDIEEVIDINNENDEDEEDKKNKEKDIDIDIDDKDDKDKDNDEDDVIIINQTSPHNSDNEN